MRIHHLLPIVALAMPAASAMPSVAHAQSTMDPEKLKLAAEEFDAGRRAYKSGDFARAASHFENAFRDAPSPQALRMAIRSRKEAGHFARAATLCVRGLALYPDDVETMRLAQSTLAEMGPKLCRVTVECEPACNLLVDGRLVRDDVAMRQVIYIPDGKHRLVAGWGKNKVAKEVNGEAGGSAVISFEEPEQPKAAPAPPPTAPPPLTESASVGTASGKASPTLFWLGAAVTTAFVGLTVASGIDTLKSPGRNNVREACVGQGKSCPEYQEGLDKQARTNYLLLSSAVSVTSVAVIGLFFTDWRGEASPQPKVSVAPEVDAVGRSVGVAATGRF